MIICADDYGLHENINEAILELAQLQKITAVSVLVDQTTPPNAERLLFLNGQVKIGLHLDLFQQHPILNFLKYIFNQQRLRLEIKRQINHFVVLFGFHPQHYDGHMHCQLWPLYRNALIEELKLIDGHEFYVRSSEIHYSIHRKSSLINKMYMKMLMKFNGTFVRLLTQNRIRTNKYIFGAFNGHMPLREILKASSELNSMDNFIVFCHPSKANLDKLPRKEEYRLLKDG